MLSSTCFETGASSLAQYSSVKSKPEIVDLLVSKLPADTEALTLKKIAGSKHVISATIDEDKLMGTCTGTGRVQIRLNNGETADQVKFNFMRLGYQVKDLNGDSKARKESITRA